MTLKELYEKRRGDGSLAACYGREKDWCIDLIPKILMATGKVRCEKLLHTFYESFVDPKLT